MNKQLHILFVGNNQDALSAMLLQLNDQLHTTFAPTGQEAIGIVGTQKIDVALIAETLSDMAGIDCLKKIVTTNPMVNCALESALSEGDYHEFTEGYGVFAQLPAQPKEADAIAILDTLKKIYQLGA